MKLYFYFLEGRKSCIRMEECEVEEKARTYRPIDRFPSAFRRSIVRKDEIGRFLALIDTSIIILTEKDPERVAELFSIRCRNDISRARNRILDAETEIEKTNDILDAIEEWRRENM